MKADLSLLTIHTFLIVSFAVARVILSSNEGIWKTLDTDDSFALGLDSVLLLLLLLLLLSNGNLDICHTF